MHFNENVADILRNLPFADSSKNPPLSHWNALAESANPQPVWFWCNCSLRPAFRLTARPLLLADTLAAMVWKRSFDPVPIFPDDCGLPLLLPGPDLKGLILRFYPDASNLPMLTNTRRGLRLIYSITAFFLIPSNARRHIIFDRAPAGGDSVKYEGSFCWVFS